MSRTIEVYADWDILPGPIHVGTLHVDVIR